MTDTSSSTAWAPATEWVGEGLRDIKAPRDAAVRRWGRILALCGAETGAVALVANYRLAGSK